MLRDGGIPAQDIIEHPHDKKCRYCREGTANIDLYYKSKGLLLCDTCYVAIAQYACKSKPENPFKRQKPSGFVCVHCGHDEIKVMPEVIPVPPWNREDMSDKLRCANCGCPIDYK